MKAPTFTTTINIDAAVDVIWRVLADIEHWPEWTASVVGVEPLDGAPLALASRYAIRQPRLRPGVWTVVAIEPGTAFTWQSIQPGVRLIATHAIERVDGATRVVLDFTFAGRLGWLFARLFRATTERYLRMEAEGLRRRAEAISQVPVRA